MKPFRHPRKPSLILQSVIIVFFLAAAGVMVFHHPIAATANSRNFSTVIGPFDTPSLPVQVYGELQSNAANGSALISGLGSTTADKPTIRSFAIPILKAVPPTIPSPTPSATASPTINPSQTAWWTATPGASPSPTATSSLDPTTTRTPTATSSPSPTFTQTPTATSSPSPTPTLTHTPPPGNDPIMFFVSDLVSSGSVSRAQAVVSLIQSLMNEHPGTEMVVASGGDNEQEGSPSLSNYQSYFGTTFSTFVTQGIFMQVRGNHDASSVGSYTDFDGTVHSSGAAYWDYFGSNAHMFNIEGKKLTDYSYDLGTWHIIGLDQVSGSVNQPTLNFLTTDLAAHSSSTCQLVYWHVPTYSSGITHGDSTGLKPFNQAEFNAGVDIQLNGHDHDYQRFLPINPDGVRDDAHGITTFVAGIGAQDDRVGSQNSIAQAASAVYLDTFPPGTSHAIGVIQFTLHTGSADYKLYDANNGAVLDSGTVMCH